VGLTACTLCPFGTFVNSSSNTACLQCDTGRVSDIASGSTTCRDCNPGEYSINSTCQPCPMGNFSAVQRSGTCTGCSPGRFANRTGLSACHWCSAGKYSDSFQMSTCSNCPAGLYSIQNASACSSCPIGAYSNPGESFCTSCAAGFYSNQSATPVCPPCELGKYTGVANSTVCSKCGNGTYADVTGSVNCQNCDLGSYNFVPGQSTCTLCAPGYYSGAEKQTTCVTCIPGRFANSSGWTTCDSCLRGNYSTVYSASTCIQCKGSGTTLNDGATSDKDCVCDEGYFGDLQSGTCKPCPTAAGVSCPLGNNTFFQLEKGYFLASIEPTQTVSCVPADACFGTVNESTFCNTGYTGFACGTCWPYLYYRNNGKCNKCPNDFTKWLTVAGATLILAALFWLIFLHGVNIPMDVKIIVQAVQLLSLFSSISGQWPPILAALFRILSFAVSFAFSCYSVEQLIRTSTLKSFLLNAQFQ
jgi:hypothetical protein